MLKLYKIYAIIFSLSLATIAFEIVLARVFSYILTYHFVYVIIALAILSYALGQLYASRVVLKKEVSLSKYFIILQFLFPISLMAIFILPSIGFVGSVSTGLILYSILAGISFFLVGLICAVIFQEYRDKIANLYALDMSGAATGAILGLFLLNNLNLIASLSAILVIFSLCSILFNYNLKKKRIFYFISSISILLISLYMILNTPRVEINMAKSTDKDLLRLQSIPSIKTKIIETRWNSFGRTDLVNFIYPDSSSSTSMFIDGAAGTEVVDISELQKDKTILAHTLAHSNLYFPFNFLNDNEKDSALIIGPGGGYDIAMAYFGDVKIIDAIEVNPTFVELMRQYNKSTFTEKQNVNIFVQEGRNFVRSTTNKYDLIFITIPITKGVRSTDFINLTENYLFTQEALRDYLSVLTNEGRIVLTLHNSEEVYKVLSNYLDMNSKFGIPNSESFKNIYVVDSGMKPLLVIKKTPFTKSEINERHFVAHRLNFDKGISFFPFIQQLEFDTVLLGENYRLTMFDNVLYDVSVNKYSFHEVTERAAINLHPVYDDSPFFFNYELGIPQNLNPLIFVGIILSIISTYMFKKNWGMVLEYKTNKELVDKRAFKLISIIAFLLGFAYILIQSYLFQKLNLYLSNPLNSFSILLFAFLLGNGFGSFLSNTIHKKRLKYVGISIAIIIIIIVLENLWLVDTTSTSLSVFVLGLIVFVPAIFIGLPFPLILAEANLQCSDNGMPILLGISGIAGFIGGVTVLVLAMTLGYFYLIVLSIILYLTILFRLIFREVKY